VIPLRVCPSDIPDVSPIGWGESKNIHIFMGSPNMQEHLPWYSNHKFLIPNGKITGREI
jgi:hypothetical protein